MGSYPWLLLSISVIVGQSVQCFGVQCKWVCWKLGWYTPICFFNGENDEQLVEIGARPFQTLRRIYICDHLDSKPEYHPLVIYKDAGKDEILAPSDGPGHSCLE